MDVTVARWVKLGLVSLGFFGSSLAASGWNRLELAGTGWNRLEPAGTKNFEKIS